MAALGPAVCFSDVMKTECLPQNFLFLMFSDPALLLEPLDSKYDYILGKLV